VESTEKVSFLSCPLCTIPDREILLYSDSLVYLVKTIDLKGHKTRVMCSIRRHSKEPTFTEKIQTFSVIYDYMNFAMCVEPWFLVDSTYCSIPDHYHLVACDTISTDPEEKIQMWKTPKIIFPIKQNILIAVPAHNEEKHIGEVIREAKKHGDVLVVVNGSTDKTAEIAKSEGAIVQNHSWSGYGRALQEIFKYAKEQNYKLLITIDGDGQHNPKEIPNFIFNNKKSDIIVGNRFSSENKTPFHRKVVIQGINKIYGIGDTQCGFRAYNRRAIEILNIAEDGMNASLEILNKAKESNLTISDIPCVVTYNDPEKPFHRVFYQGMTLIEIIFWGAIWSRPYTFLGLPAFLLFLISIGSGSYAFYLYLSLGYLIPSLALICGISFLSSMALGTITFIITIQRRLSKELGVRS
jgi:glycosyltransferase involved in cell wall biosynthesis